jgi:hypothetical protein
MATKSKKSMNVETIRHADDRRRNIPYNNLKDTFT